MSKARERLEAIARKNGIAKSAFEKLTNEELANLIKDKTGTKPVIANNNPGGGELKHGEVIAPNHHGKHVTQVPAGAQVAFVMQPAPVTLLPTAAPFNANSAWYVVWAIGSAFVQWVQPYLVGYLMGVLTSGFVLATLSIRAMCF